MQLFVGLGNPGREHAAQRHNIGFRAIDAIARKLGGTPFRSKFRGQVSEVAVGSERVVLLKPDTFMNQSGLAVRDAASFFKLALSDIVVFHDELDIEPGKVKIKVGGGNAGHNGLRSITSELGNDYRRVRIGIGHPGSKDRVLGYVLGDFAKSEGWVEPICEALAESAADLVRGRDSEVQNRLHQVWLEKQADRASD